ncbi:hypothetical protein K1T35_34560 [Pseudonocardia sp. DSM 110487]|uniref:hypothetical protein n=1 Tax=Pseudonocardia sp. DSM 110487 TaxID=2865833 RepID=UPI001C6A4EF6|nr:hypothetical protein [Pseudonocardia sp. DSM 110487]QYN33577.1 hypothetical protein K1T35_34560 [Pseudonocardia sp. DSM 110487]
MQEIGRAACFIRTPHILRKPADPRGYAMIPRRWAVERTFASLTEHRRLTPDLKPRRSTTFACDYDCAMLYF